MRETELVFQQASLCKSCLSLVRSPFLCRYLQNCYRDLGKTNKVLITVYKLYYLFMAPPTRIRTLLKPHFFLTGSSVQIPRWFRVNWRLICGFKNIRICVDGASLAKRNYCQLPSQLCSKMNFYLITSLRTNPDAHSRNTG